MSNPGYVPHNYVRRGFGQTWRPPWVLAPGGTLDLLRASVLHHLYSFGFWTAYKAEWDSEDTFCEDAGIKIGRLTAMQRGEAVMQTTDIALFVRMLEVGDLPTPEQIVTETTRALGLIEEAEKAAEADVQKRAGLIDEEGRVLVYAGHGPLMDVMMINTAREAIAEEARALDKTVAYIAEIATSACGTQLSTCGNPCSPTTRPIRASRSGSKPPIPVATPSTPCRAPRRCSAKCVSARNGWPRPSAVADASTSTDTSSSPTVISTNGAAPSRSMHCGCCRQRGRR